MDDLISRAALYDKAAKLEAQALDYVGKLIERDGDEPSVEWKIWSAILIERTAFKHDVYDAPSAQPERKKGEWIDNETSYADGVVQTCNCSECGRRSARPLGDFCRWCGADMR